jgi:hypothetical protein
LTAALRSRSRITPQCWHSKDRSARVRLGFRRPQAEQVFEDGYHRPAATSVEPYQRVL